MVQPFGIVLIFGTVSAVVVALCTTLFEQRGVRIAAGALAGGWVGFLIDATTSGAIRELPVLLGLFLTPFALAAVLSIALPGMRDRLLAIPRRTILAMNLFRVEGFFFLFLAASGQLGGPFPYFAGIGDILTGLLAIPLLLREPQLERNDRRLMAWNVLGFLDLVTAVTLGVTSGNGTPLQLIHAGAGSQAIGELPWSMIPLFLVPCFMIGHVIIFAQMRASARRSQYAHA